MAETITGAKSKLYIKEPIPGITESSDTLQHVTAQEITGNRVGLDTVIHGVYKTHVPPKLIEAGSVKRLIKITAHGARKGDVLKINNGAAVGEEVAIVKVEDADTLVIATEINAAIGDEVFIMRHVTPLYDKNGNLNVNATPGPAQFVLDGVDTEVNRDTVAPANNKPMPSGLFILKDGVYLPVAKDTGTPANTVSIPVDVVSGGNQLAINADGSINTGEIAKSVSKTLFFDYSASPVNNTTWVQLIASTSDNSKHLTWFESGGYAMEVGIGAIGLEVRAFVIPPGGLNGQIDLPIPAGVRVSIRCLEAVTVNVGIIVSNLLK